MRNYLSRLKASSLLATALLAFSTLGYGENKPEGTLNEKKDTQIEFVATVNGSPITKGAT